MLLNRLEAIGKNHKELFDSDVRQEMSNAIMEGFVRASRSSCSRTSLACSRQTLEPFALDVAGHLVGHGGGHGALAGAEAEDMNLREANLFHHATRFFELSLGFAGETDDYVGC